MIYFLEYIRVKMKMSNGTIYTRSLGLKNLIPGIVISQHQKNQISFTESNLRFLNCLSRFQKVHSLTQSCFGHYLLWNQPSNGDQFLQKSIEKEIRKILLLHVWHHLPWNSFAIPWKSLNRLAGRMHKTK